MREKLYEVRLSAMVQAKSEAEAQAKAQELADALNNLYAAFADVEDVKEKGSRE